MYKIAIISDIHGNDIALREVLNNINGKVDEIICLGDMIGIGPNGNNVLKIVTQLDNFHTVLGNHERYYLYGLDNPLSCIRIEHQMWVKKEISDEYYDYIKNIPLEIKRNYLGYNILFTHYARPSEKSMRFEVIERDVNYPNLVNIFKNHDFDYVFYGHEHLKSVVEKEGGKHFINPGSLGCPHPDKNKARYGIISIDKEIKYQEYEIIYDPKPLIIDMEKKEMPDRSFIAKAFFHEEI